MSALGGSEHEFEQMASEHTQSQSLQARERLQIQALAPPLGSRKEAVSTCPGTLYDIRKHISLRILPKDGARNVEHVYPQL